MVASIFDTPAVQAVEARKARIRNAMHTMRNAIAELRAAGLALDDLPAELLECRTQLMKLEARIEPPSTRACF